ncbi:MAG: type I methionyl aminopeptidase [Candidatus Woykebacteria bacterium RBG_16_44_10]|uniref:Methionine aminopeptidase n=1 Tax=Candidatus Woykebacteria bacterium RBG_16_44_10 TaxID=1802597 RepID=A0A1G1WE75_9BACT|nr:MAG: type I methionyl aminopeptidase [Candidatus Woykebacteria bacterium RBG_16_44_10]
MIYLKTQSEIEIMYRAGQIAAAALIEIAKNIKPGIKTSQLDTIAETKIRDLGAESSFKKVEGYHYNTCITPNDLVVHGVPSDYTLSEGDVLGADLGAYYRGFHSDLAYTFPVGKVSSERKKFLSVGMNALWEAIKEVRIGSRIGDISNKIQTVIEGSGYSVVRELVGHGVGRELHEDPLVPGRGKKGTGEELKEGMVIAIEVIYNFGKPGVRLLSDGWSIATSDSSVSGLFEHTIAVTKKGPLVLTQKP